MFRDEFASNQKVNRLVEKVYELNENIDKLENFLKERDKISQNETRKEKDDKPGKKGKDKKKVISKNKNDYLRKEKDNLSNKNKNIKNE